jgi:hypothetical protein
MLLKLAQQTGQPKVLQPGVSMKVFTSHMTMKLVFDMRCDPGKDWVAEVLLRHLKFSLLSKNKALQCLPHFQALERSGTEAQLKVATLPLSLRTVLNDRTLVLQHGQGLVKSLLLAKKSLEDQGIIVRNLAP